MTTRVLTFDFHGQDVPRCRSALRNLLDRHSGQDVTLVCVHGRGAGLLAAEIARIGGADPRVKRVEPDPTNDGVTRLHLAGTRRPLRRPRAYDPDEPPERRRKRR